MIACGDFVQDWMGRAGIILGPGKQPESDSFDRDLARIIEHWNGNLHWWRVALLSGSIVESPEPAMDSWGPVKKGILEWAIRRNDGEVANQLRWVAATCVNGEPLVDEDQSKECC